MMGVQSGQSVSYRKRIDFHTHILPGMDDGSRSVEMSLQMLAASAEQGVGVIALTPHFYPTSDDPQHFLEKRNARMAHLKEHVPSGAPRLLAGAEVQYFEGLSAMQQLPLMRIEKSSALLIEMPMGKWTQRMLQELMELNRQGEYRVVLAHIERYLPFDNLRSIRQLAGVGVMMQMTSDVFSGWLRAGRALRLFDEGLLHILGSDCHNMTSRPPNLSAAYEYIEQKRGAAAVRQIIDNGMQLFAMGGRVRS